MDIFNRTLRGRLNEISIFLTRSVVSIQPFLHAKKKIAAQLSIKLLLKLKSFSRKGNNRVYLKEFIAYFSVVFNSKGRALYTFVYISLEAEELLF